MKKNHVAIAIVIALCACSKKDSTPPPPGEQIALNETFDNPANAFWPAGTGRAIQGGQLVVTHTSTEARIVTFWAEKDIWSAQDKIQSIEIQQTHATGHAYDKGGIVFSFKDIKNYLGFQIGDAAYRVYSQVDDKTTNIVNWVNHSAIKGALNETNKLKITMADGIVSFYINDQKVYAAQAGGLTTLDKVGFQMLKGSFVNETCTYKIDYIKALK